MKTTIPYIDRVKIRNAARANYAAAIKAFNVDADRVAAAERLRIATRTYDYAIRLLAQ